MKKFVVKFLAFLVLIICSIGILNFLYVNTNYWKMHYVDETVKFKNIPQHIQLANVGSSHGVNSFKYDNVPYRSFNFALGGQRFLYDYAVLKQYIHYFEKNAVLLIPISYFQITTIKRNFKDQHGRYYLFLENELMDSYSIPERILFSFIPVLTSGNTLRYIIKDFTRQPPEHFMTEQELIRNSKTRYEDWITGNTYEYEAGEEGFIHNKHIVSQIIELCYTNDIQPVLVTTPITSVLNNIYKENSPDFFDTFYRFSRELQEAYPSLLYLDYSHDPRFENDFSLFSNADHLNSIGAEKFTSIVIHELQTNGIVIP